ncbi:MAG TPA: hypothetical protein VF580_02720, partial [Thermoanaerobaculia bacterium]
AIVAAIRAGSFDWVAAEANGITRETLRLWLRKGARDKRKPYVAFSDEVRAARAQARLSAEIEVRRDQPFNWLRFGPGRERDGEAGWTESTELRHSGSVGVMYSQEWTLISVAIEAALESFPEAKLAVAEAMKRLASASPEP